MLCISLIDKLQSQAMRLAVSTAMGPTPFSVGRFDGHVVGEWVGIIESLVVNSLASIDTLT